MLNHLDLFFCSFVRKMLFRIFSKKEEAITETKKCMNCLKRIKTSFYRCPHCRTTNFVFNTDWRRFVWKKKRRLTVKMSYVKCRDNYWQINEQGLIMMKPQDFIWSFKNEKPVGNGNFIIIELLSFGGMYGS